MKIPVLAMPLLAVVICAADETAFRDVKLASATGTLTNATVTFSDDTKAVVVRVADGRLLTISYNQIDKLSYEYTKKHRIKQGVALGLLSPGTGIIVAFTKSKNHWLDIDFHEEKALNTLVLKLDKRDYQKVCDAAKVRTGKEVAMLGKTSTKSITGKIKN